MRRPSRGQLCHLPTITDPGSGRAGLRFSLGADPQMIGSLGGTAGAPYPCFLGGSSSFTAPGLHVPCGTIIPQQPTHCPGLSPSAPVLSILGEVWAALLSGDTGDMALCSPAEPGGSHRPTLLSVSPPEVCQAPEVSAASLAGQCLLLPLVQTTAASISGVAVTLQPVPRGICGQ